jgi:hypothetical protein
MKKLILFIIMLLLISVPAILLFAAGPGTSAANFLKLGVGARAAGMGESFAAVADDISSVCWNPAGLARLKSAMFSASHTVWFQDINYEFLGFGMPLPPRMNGTIAMSAQYLYLNDMERRTSNTAEPEGRFGADDLVVTMSYARSLTSRIGTGINIKTIRQQIDNKTASAYAADLGLQYRAGQFGYGAAIQNIGTSVKFINESFPLPRNYKFGIAWMPLGTALTVALDVNKPLDNKIDVHIGTEYWLGDIVAFRAGYLKGDAVQRNALTGKGFSGSTKPELAAYTGMMAGAGFKILNYGLDYAFVPYGELGNTHRISLNVKF